MSDAMRAKADKLSHQQSVHAHKSCRARMPAMSIRPEIQVSFKEVPVTRTAAI